MPIIVSGTTITFNDATTQSTAGKTGTVTSVDTGNGLSGGPITSTGTLVVACPTYNTVGSYVLGGKIFTGPGTIEATSGTNYSAGGGQTQIQSCATSQNSGGALYASNNLSGTWKWMGATTGTVQDSFSAVCCRVS